MTEIRWGIIGCGNVTEVKSGPGFQKATGSRLVAVMRRDGELAADYARRHNVQRWYDDGQALINDPDVDAVYIATPPNAHRQYTLMAATAGKPVYVEKPMAMNFGECEDMIAACREANVPLRVAYYRRALPKFLRIKALIDNGAIGAVRGVKVSLMRSVGNWDQENLPWRVRPEVAGGGLFVDLGAHVFDFLDFVLGPISEASGRASNQGRQYPAEDSVTGNFRFASGVHGTASFLFCGYAHQDETEIIGDAGTLSFATFRAEEPIVLTTSTDREEIMEPEPEHVQQPLIQSIVDELAGRRRCQSTGESAARTNWVMDQMLR